MLQWILKKTKKDNKGFTLVELVVVIAILGILAAIAVPRLSKSRTSAAIIAHNANVRTLESAANMYIADLGVPEEEIGEDKLGDYVQEWPVVPKELIGLDIEYEDGEEVTEINENTVYKATIEPDGTIKVIPGKIKEVKKKIE